MPVAVQVSGGRQERGRGGGPGRRRRPCPVRVLVAFSVFLLGVLVVLGPLCRPTEVLYVVGHAAQGKAAKFTTVLRMEAIGNCPEYTGLANGFSFSEIVPQGRTQVGRGTFMMNHSYTKFTKADVRIRKCAERSDPHCQSFQNWVFKDESCGLLNMKNMIWTPLMAFKPLVLCPVKQGVHTLENATLDVSRLKAIRFPEDGYWKVSVVVDADHIQRVLCYYFEATFIKVRV